jgi:uncharacterized protein (DUF433 family)
LGGFFVVAIIKLVKKLQSATTIGRFIVSDPKICHGQPTFSGTRILVADVLEQVASGLAWESIVEEWRDSVSRDAIAEALRLSRQAFLDYSGRYVVPDARMEPLRA